MQPSEVDFIRQQGFTTAGCQDGLYSALMFQPRAIAGVVIARVVLQSPWLFLALATVLWSSALVPGHNPFDAFFNHVMADPIARRHACGAPAEAILAGRGRHVCHEHHCHALHRSVARSLADRGPVRRRVDECRRPPILPPSLRVLSVVSNSRHTLSIARVNPDPLVAARRLGVCSRLPPPADFHSLRSTVGTRRENSLQNVS
jgi:hypothetical protein